MAPYGIMQYIMLYQATATHATQAIRRPHTLRHRHRPHTAAPSLRTPWHTLLHTLLHDAFDHRAQTGHCYIPTCTSHCFTASSFLMPVAYATVASCFAPVWLALVWFGLVWFGLVWFGHGGPLLTTFLLCGLSASPVALFSQLARQPQLSH